VSAREAKLNVLMAKGAKVGKISGELAKKTSQILIRQKKQILEQGAKEIAFGKNRDADGKKQLAFTDKLAKHYLMVRDAVTIAFRAAKAMTIDAMEAGNELTKMTAAMKFEIDLFSAGTKEGAQFKEIEKFTSSLGKGANYTKELTEQFLKFRRAGEGGLIPVSNKEAAHLLLLYADIRAISQSTEQADKITGEWINKFKEAPYLAARFEQEIKKAHKGWEDIGTGKFAKTTKGPLDIEDKVDKAKNKMAQALAPLTKLLNDLKSSFADFMVKLASNKMFKNFIAGVADSIRWMIEKGLPALGAAIGKFADQWKAAGAEIEKSGMKWFDKIGDNLKKDLLNGPQGEPPPARAPKPADKDKGASLDTKKTTQLAGITIQNLNVNGDGQDADQIARSVRQEMQLLLQAGGLSRGIA
jgi:hypothetical protein